MNDGDLAVFIHVGMGVQVGRRTVGSPTCVGNAGDRTSRQLAKNTLEVGEATRTLPHGDLAPRGRNGDTSRVVAAVLKKA